MAFFIEGIKFDIKYKDVFKTMTDKAVALDNHFEFLEENTTLEKEEIKTLLKVMSKGELIDFIYSKIDTTDEETFAKRVNIFVSRVKGDFDYAMILFLSELDYKVTDLFKLSKMQLLDVFMFELVKNSKKINFERVKLILSPHFKEDTVESFIKVFEVKEQAGKEDGGIDQLIRELDDI